MKTIDTLVEDIYGLFTSDFKPSDSSVESFGRRLARHISNRVSEERSVPSLRLSNLGSPCNRKLWYSIHTPDDGESLSPQTRIKFLYGDILEELLLFLAEQAGHKVEGQQDELNAFGVKGHRDAIIDGCTVDVKSASSYSFAKFANHLMPADDSFGYLLQLDAYVSAGESDPKVTVKDQGAFLAVDKTLGKLCLDKQPKRNIDYETLIREKREILECQSPPPRAFSPEPDGKSGNEKLPMVCAYCSFKRTCWPGLRGYAYSGGPRFLTTTIREPDVPRIF